MDRSASPLAQKYDTLLGEIEQQCLKIYNQEIQVEPYCEDTKTLPWFGDIQSWWEEIKEKTDPSIFQSFPSAIRNHLARIGYDLNYLLPQSDLVKQFLPILLNSYVVNYQYYSLFFKNIVCGEEGSVQSELIEKIFRTPSWEERYKKLSSRDCTLDNVARAVPVYLNAIQFLIFFKYTSQKYNVTVSFYYFDRMTGYLGLLGNIPRHLAQKFWENESKPLEKSNFDYRKEMARYVDSIVSNLFYLGDPLKKVIEKVKAEFKVENEDTMWRLAQYFLTFWATLIEALLHREGKEMRKEKLHDYELLNDILVIDASRLRKFPDEDFSSLMDGFNEDQLRALDDLYKQKS